MAEVKTFYDKETGTASHIFWCTATKKAAIVDSVLGYDISGAKTDTTGLDQIVSFIQQSNLSIEYILETHAHADHLTGASYLKSIFGTAKIGIGAKITTVQRVFSSIFNLGADFKKDGSQFDVLFNDGEEFKLGNLSVHILHVPGHTPADIAYYIPSTKMLFPGDTIFMPDSGTARCDFPEGSVQDLWNSIQKLMSLPDDTRIFVCHDYAPGGREPKWETTIAEEKEKNIHVKVGTEEQQFVRWRTERDATLAAPKLIIPSIQVNINNGHFPHPESNGHTYLKVPVNVISKPVGNTAVTKL